MALVTKPEALYFDPESIGDDKGARCGICRFYANLQHSCQIVTGRIDPLKGICGLYLKTPVSKSEAGYSEEGPTHCASCEEMLIPKLFGESRCKKVEGMIEGRGCCSLWQKR